MKTKVIGTPLITSTLFTLLLLAPVARGQQVITVVTDPATSISDTGATLNGTVNGNGEDISAVYFDWGPNAAPPPYDNTSINAVPPSVPAAQGQTPVSLVIGGLSCGTVYHFRVTADDQNGRNWAGGDLTFTTTSCPTDLSITKTDGVAVATPGGTTTYTITALNAGPSAVTGASVTDSFPAACTNVSYTSVVTGGATGNTAAGSGNINDTALDLPVAASITYTATCTLNPAATGTLANTASVTAPGSITDVDPSNNSATDSDTLAQQATGSKSIPVFSIWGLGTLIGLFGLVLARLRRRV